jgi:AraC-like DNA-binding protein
MPLDPAPPDFRLLQFSSEEYPAHSRLAAWQDVLTRKLINAKVAAAGAEPFHADVRLRAQAGLRIAGGLIDGSHNHLHQSDKSEDLADVAMLICLSGEIVTSYRGREQILRDNDAILFSCSEPGHYGWRKPAQVVLLRVPRARLEPLARDLQDVTGRLVSSETDMLRLLIQYVSTLFSGRDFAMTPGADHVVSNHICDLVALSLGASRDAAALTVGRGRHAARLRIIKADVLRNLERTDLSIETLAASHQLSPRAVQRLFEREGTTLSTFVLERRLQRAHRILLDERFADRSISTIAFESGFSEVSYFNRSFRKQYGASPSAIRSGRAS